MLFNSLVFFLFFAAFFAAYWRLRASLRSQNALILAGSYFFYGWWDERFLALIALSTICDYLSGLGAAGEKLRRDDLAKCAGFLAAALIVAFALRFGDSAGFFLLALAASAALAVAFAAIDRLEGDRRRRAFLLVSLVFNLGLLATFKYFGFFVESLEAASASLGMNISGPTVSIILPIGISFYTFQTLSYTIDIYRGDMRPMRRLVDFAAYVSFFPQLVAGPIERARALLPQFEKLRTLDFSRAESGVYLFLWGLYKKTVIADNLAPVVQSAFADPATADPNIVTVGVIAFAVQIFCDFSGYSDMARGLARLLGFELMINFRLPYFARTPSEFWRGWHISLSTWLRDYLYRPLGGNRCGRLTTLRNLMVTMLLGGLWHGAALTFIVWGAFHGAILVVYRVLGVDRFLERTPSSRAVGAAIHVGAWAAMTALTLCGWTFFRAETLGDAVIVLQQMARSLAGGDAAFSLFATPEWRMLAVFAAPLAAAQVAQRFFPAILAQVASAVLARPRLALAARAHMALALVMTVAFFPAEGQQQFIYFDF